MKTIRILREAFTRSLSGNVAHNLQLYKREKSWVAETPGSEQWELETNLAPAQPIDLLQPTRDDLKDIENAIRIHKALPGLTPINARDPRLWTRLTHVE